MSKLNFYETGLLAPANIVREFGSIYIHQTIKGPIAYRQNKFPSGRLWQIDSDVTPIPPITIPDVGIGNSLFVSSIGKTIADGAIRESLTDHFSSLGEAVSAAQYGDTIYVYGGTHANTGNLYKDGVNYEFIGYPTLSAGTTMFTDLGVASLTPFRVKGNAIIQNSGNAVFNFTGLDNVIDLECESIITNASIPILFTDVQGTLKINGKIVHTSNINGIVFRGNSRVKVYADEIQNITTNTNSNYGTIYFDVSTVPYFSGNVEITANKIHRNGGRAGLIRIGHNSTNLISGKVVINCPDINYTTSASANASNNAIALVVKATNDFELFINGNITVSGNTNSAYYIYGAYNNLGYFNVTHNGNITTTSPNATDTILFFNSYGGQATDVNITFKNGEAINDGYIQRMFVCEGGIDNVLTFENYKIYNYYDSGALTQTGISIAPTVDLRLNNVLIYTPNAFGSPYPIASTAPTNIRVYQGQVCANIAPDVNITNLITGTSIIVDTDVI